ncbi:hypothetical protein HaLaN_25058 [Haematococcus lacustris]|uniref:Uncharacterized protein n=1 Tax=Haematococcus lacustris TaxID=44745 RepID=A0A699ZZM2_HAELA|nr:hypothetical protein HaLaN_25058 [Haematococcus lacustris]
MQPYRTHAALPMQPPSQLACRSHPTHAALPAHAASLPSGHAHVVAPHVLVHGLSGGCGSGCLGWHAYLAGREGMGVSVVSWRGRLKRGDLRDPGTRGEHPAGLRPLAAACPPAAASVAGLPAAAATGVVGLPVAAALGAAIQPPFVPRVVAATCSAAAATAAAGAAALPHASPSRACLPAAAAAVGAAAQPPAAVGAAVGAAAPSPAAPSGASQPAAAAVGAAAQPPASPSGATGTNHENILFNLIVAATCGPNLCSAAIRRRGGKGAGREAAGELKRGSRCVLGRCNTVAC